MMALVLKEETLTVSSNTKVITSLVRSNRVTLTSVGRVMSGVYIFTCSASLWSLSSTRLPFMSEIERLVNDK